MSGQIESVAIPSTVNNIHAVPQGLLLLVGDSGLLACHQLPHVGLALFSHAIDESLL